jgi:hypothetical protein
LNQADVATCDAHGDIVEIIDSVGAVLSARGPLPIN